MGISVKLQSFYVFFFFRFNSRILYNVPSGWYRLSGTSFSRDDKREVRERGRAMGVLDDFVLLLFDSPYTELW